MGGACGTCGGDDNCIQGYDGETQGNTLLGISRRKWEDTVKMDVKEMRWDTVHWIRLAKDRAKWRAFLNTRWWKFVFRKMRAIC